MTEVDYIEQDLKKFSLNGGLKEFYRGHGCPKCFNSGYRGRKGLFEILTMNEDVRRLILDKRSSDEIKTLAQEKGMKTLRQCGVQALKDGVTTPEEVLRVTQETEEINV